MKSIGTKSALVLERATYHTVIDGADIKPVSSWNKTRICGAISRWGGAPKDCRFTWRTKKKKSELLEYARQIYPLPKYKIKKIADKYEGGGFNIDILFLPVAHPELNPIEMVWYNIKKKVPAKNMDFKLSSVKEHAKNEIAKVTATEFGKFVAHTLKVEEIYKNLSCRNIVYYGWRCSE